MKLICFCAGAKISPFCPCHNDGIQWGASMPDTWYGYDLT